jgi:hypothetical protein
MPQSSFAQIWELNRNGGSKAKTANPARPTRLGIE